VDTARANPSLFGGNEGAFPPVEGVLKVLFAPFVIAGLTRNPLINSIIFLGGSGFRRNDAWLSPE